MNRQLSKHWEAFVRSQVQSGRFAAAEDVMDEALRLLEARTRVEAENPDGIRRGLDDVDAGRTEPLAEAFAEIRRDLDLSPGR